MSNNRSASRHHIRVRSACYWIINAVSLLRIVNPNGNTDWIQADITTDRVLDKDWDTKQTALSVLGDCQEVSQIIEALFSEFDSLNIWDDPSIGMQFKNEGQHHMREMANTAQAMTVISQRQM